MNLRLSTKILFLLRALALILLIVVAAKPVIVRPDPGVPARWAVLLDTSASMRVQDPVRRLDQAKKVVGLLAKKFSRASFFQFSDSVSTIDPLALGGLLPTGRRTDLAGAINKTLSGNEYKGEVIITDGRHVGAGDAVSEAAAAGRPLLLVGVGNASLFKDVAVKSIQAPPFAFKNVQTSLAATLSVIGYPGRQIVVKLREGDSVLSVQTVQIAGSNVEASVSFSWVPHSLGSKVLTVEADPYAGEVTTVNNRKDVTLDVGRDRFRVLYLCGQPGPEYGFLRHQFKADPAVELVTFVILRNANNAITVPDSELSLIPFPTQDVLINQISTFDLVVFEEFAYQLYGLMPNVLYAIRQKVQDGGSFLLLGGPVALGAGSSYNIPGFKEVIPVEFGTSDVRETHDDVQFVPKALSHPILRLEESSERNRDVWAQLPPLDGATLLPGVKPGASVLGTAAVGGKEYPLLTAWKFGKGRSAVLAARTTWRWSMLNGKKEHSSYAYQQFWKNMVLWLTHSDEFKMVRVALENKDAKQGETDPVHAWVYDEYFKPISDVDVQLRVTTPDGKTQSLAAHPETTGVFVAPFKAEQLGAHAVEAWVTRKGKKFGEDRLAFRVVESHVEEEDLRPDFSLLKELARATGGRFVTAEEFTPATLDEFDQDISKKIGKKVLLWNSPWLLGAIALVLLAEWILRKRRGLP